MRVRLRLLVFIWITLVEVLSCALKISRNPKKRKIYQAFHRSNWAKRSCKNFGMELEITGEICQPLPYVLVSNHRSYLDILIILSISPTTLLAKAEVRKYPLIGWAAKVGGTLFVDREDRQSRQLAVKQLADALEQQICVALFPEGTTHNDPGIHEYKIGSFRVAAENNYPVIPVAIVYESDVYHWYIKEQALLPHLFQALKQKKFKVRLAIGPVFRDPDAVRLRDKVMQWTQETLQQLQFTKA